MHAVNNSYLLRLYFAVLTQFYHFAVCNNRRKKNMQDDHRFGAYLALEALKKAREVLPADHAADKKLVAGLLQISVRTV